jgi:hypothetical protein
MLKWTSSDKFIRHGLALTAVLGASVAFAGAQTTSASTSPDSTSSSSSSAQLFSSSAQENAPEPTTEATLLQPVNFANMMQYGGGQRARYGRPRYRGSNTNQDGSNKYTFYAGVGLQQPVGNTWHYVTPSYAFGIGVGRQFNKHFAIPVEFNWDNAGLTKQTLDNQFALYNNDTNYFCSQAANAALCAADGVADLTSLDGNAHVWSFSVDPTYTFFQGEKVGAYALVGAGFYHKVTNFETPEVEEIDTFYGPEEYEANAIIDHYTSNAPGFNAGFGFTYKFSRFSNERFYGEVRYVFVDNSQRTGVTVNSPVNSTTVAATNDFPANSNRTTYFPIKFGIRF